MKIYKLFDIENDGLNMAVDNQSLYIRCKRSMYKYNLSNMIQTAQNDIFKKDGKARSFSICDEYIFLTDFCDLFIINKDDLQVVESMRLGEDLTSDLGTVRFDAQKAYISIRNGKMAVMDKKTWKYNKYDISESSFWDFISIDNKLYVGTVQGELLEIDTNSMRTIKKIELGKKNIYSVILNDNLIYTTSQDMTIKATNSESFEIVSVAKKAVRGMAKILGIYKDTVVVADSNKISFWDKHSLQIRNETAFPTGHFNKGVILNENKLYGSDYHSVYCAELE